MKKIKILQVDLLNFKGFGELHVSFEAKDAVVLGGLNGYGKTTLFDALELLFTGSIKRMEDYVDYHDKRNGMNQEVLPLVYKKDFSDVVIVKAIIQIEEVTHIVFRKANVRDMRNPVDFSAFSDLMLHTDDGEEKLLTDEEKKSWGLDELRHSYSFLNYLSQEEATAFLKKKEVDRAKDISELFNLTPFDVPLDKIKTVSDSLKGKNLEAKRLKENAQKMVNSLKKTVGAESSAVPYQKLCKEPQYWDAEELKLSHEQFHSLLAEGCLMDKLLLLAQNKEVFRQYRINKFVDFLLQDESRIRAIAFEKKYGHQVGNYVLYRQFGKNVVTPCLNIALDNLDKFSLHIPDPLLPLVEASDIKEFELLKDNLQKSYSTSSSFQRRMSQMMDIRETLAIQVKENAGDLPSTDCPLCGTHFASKKDMDDSIQKYSEVLSKYFSEVGVNLQKQLSLVRGYIQNHFIKPVNHFFLQQGITSNRYNEYSELDLQSARKNISMMETQLGILVSDDKPYEGIVSELKMQLLTAKKNLPNEAEFQELDNVYNIAGRFISKELLTVEAVSAKRSYLQMCWSQMASQELQKWQKDLERYENREKAIGKLQKNLGKLKKELNNQRQAYFSRLLSDIKILFYIYSGRIMQTCYFGRGLFIKPDKNCKHIIFTSDSNEGNDVDALYNMSSGQLVTLVISLLLSLNKLYSKNTILAIDDPIQTIDDINLWGLIETLRHDFNDLFMILSTHERDYRDLLAYKFGKWGIDTKVVDMAKVEPER